jgi:sec-independent protein translocase protein TatA
MPNFGVWEWLVILVIVLVIFGASRLKDIGSGLGGAINAFRSEVRQGKEEEEKEEEARQSTSSAPSESASVQPNEETEEA